MTTLPSERPDHQHLVTQRFSERQRQAELRRRIADIDPKRHGRAMEAMQQAVRATAKRLAEIDAAIAGEVEPSRPDSTTIDQAKVELRQKLMLLDMVIARHTPDSCERPARRLRRGIALELNRLAATAER